MKKVSKKLVAVALIMLGCLAVSAFDCGGGGGGSPTINIINDSDNHPNDQRTN